MKKLISFAVALIIAMSVMCFTVSAAGITVTSNNPDCAPGQEVSVYFSVSKNSSIASANFVLQYDGDLFTYKSHGYGSAFMGGMTVGNNSAKGTFEYAFIKADGTDEAGEMFFVTFLASNNVKVGESYEMNLTVPSVTDEDLNKLTIEPVKVTLKATETLPSTTPAPSDAASGDTPATQSAQVDTASTAVSQSGTLGETILTQSAQKELDDAKEEGVNNSNNSQNKAKKLDIKLIIIIGIVAITLIAIAIVVISVVSSKKPKDDAVMQNILADNAELDSFFSDDDETVENDEE